EPLPKELALQHTLTARAERLPEATRTLLLVAAADGAGDTAVILRAASALGAEDGVEPAELAGIVPGGADGLPLRDPALRSALYQGAPFGRRQAAHRALADAIGDADRRAFHRSAATVGPDDDVADELEQSAVRARARGGHAAASAALERAADLTEDSGLAGRR